MVTCMEAQELHCFKCENPNKKKYLHKTNECFCFLEGFLLTGQKKMQSHDFCGEVKLLSEKTEYV